MLLQILLSIAVVMPIVTVSVGWSFKDMKQNHLCNRLETFTVKPNDYRYRKRPLQKSWLWWCAVTMEIDERL